MKGSHGRQLIRAGVRLILLPAVGMLVGALAAGVVTLQMPKTYRAEASVIVVPTQSPLTGQLQLSDVSLAQSLVTSVALLAESQDVAATTVQRAGVPVGEVNGQLKGVTQLGTQIVTVQATASTPAGAAALATAASQAIATRAGDLRLGGDTIKFNPLDQAIVPSTPASPRPVLNVAIGAFLGLIVGIGMYTLQRHYGDRFHRVAEVEHDLDMAALAVLPVRTTTATRRVSNLYDDREMRAAVDALVAALSIRSPHGDRRILLTGAGDDRGSALVAALLAVALKRHGLTVAVLDAVPADLAVDRFLPRRRPRDPGAPEEGEPIEPTSSMSPRLDEPPEPDGGGDDVLDRAALDRLSSELGRWVEPVESVHAEPVGGLRVDQLGPLIDKRAAEGAEVIVRTPPVLGGPGFAELARHADVVLLVVDSDNVRRMDAVRSAQLVLKLDVDVTGLVVVGAAADDDRWLAPTTEERRT